MWFSEEKPQVGSKFGVLLKFLIFKESSQILLSLGKHLFHIILLNFVLLALMWGKGNTFGDLTNCIPFDVFSKEIS